MKPQSTPIDMPWWQKGVIYQIYPRSFKDTSGNGVGDLEGVIAKLDYLNDGSSSVPPGAVPSSLGVDAIWLSPFYPSPMADFGYDVANYVDVDPLFGDLSTFDRLVEEIHMRGMKIIIDYVPNHTSDRHPWFIESRSSRKNSKRNWYIWRDPKPGGAPPNNWKSVFGGLAWTLDERTGQFYLHQFLKEQPEFNWREPQVREAMLDVLKFWLERGVDGFRMDVVGMLIKDVELRDNPSRSSEGNNSPEKDTFANQLHLYNEDQDEVHQVIREFRKLLDRYGDRCAIGEVWYETRRWVKYYGRHGDGLHLPFNFRLMHQPWNADAIRCSVDELEAALPPFGWPNYVLGSHDVPRLASRIGVPQARLAAMLLLTLRGTPTLYFGDELGMRNGVITPENMQDPQGFRLGLHHSRDVSRTPMQWDQQSYAGFTEVEPWLPVAEGYKECNVARQNDEPASMLNLYRRLLWYRRNTPALFCGTYHPIEAGEDGCYVYLRKHPDSSRIIALNFEAQPQIVSIPEGSHGEVVISTHLDRAESVSFSNLALRPHEGVIIEVSS
jgi:alpha-glucosidase